jgi:hypothetical protein
MRLGERVFPDHGGTRFSRTGTDLSPLGARWSSEGRHDTAATLRYVV